MRKNLILKESWDAVVQNMYFVKTLDKKMDKQRKWVYTDR